MIGDMRALVVIQCKDDVATFWGLDMTQNEFFFRTYKGSPNFDMSARTHALQIVKTISMWKYDICILNC